MLMGERIRAVRETKNLSQRDIERRYGIRNLRFNQSLIEMFERVDMLGVPERTAGEEAFEMVVPAMKVREFNFTEVTKF